MIDILMATYNGEKFLKDQLESIENQSYTNWRLIVHDDASTDRTWEILKQFQERLGKNKVIIKKNSPASGSAKKNFLGLLQVSSSPYIMCCDQDDVWHRDKVEKTFCRMLQMEKRYGRKKPLLVHTDLRVVDADLSELHPEFHKYMNLRTDGRLKHVLIQNQVTGCTLMMNRALMQYAERIEDASDVVMHDHWMALAALVFGKMSYINSGTMDYRQHGTNSVGAKNARSFDYMWQRFLAGKKKFRKDMENSCQQAGYFLCLYASCINDKKMIKLLDIYANLYKKNKLERIICFFCHGFWKKGLIRKVMQIVWG